MAGAQPHLSRREQQVMDVLFRARQATVAEVVDELNGEMTYSAVRSVLRVLVGKGEARRKYAGPHYVYAPATRAEQARASAIEHLVQTFFDGSVEAAAVALLRASELDLDERGLRQLAERIRKVEMEGR
jgi:BlaI family penicillinase repressor